MLTVIERLRFAIQNLPGVLSRIWEAESKQRPSSERWSKKEVVGHLIDSASNNHQRFVRAALYGPLIFPGYEQDALAKLQRANDVDWSLLVRLWESYNLYVAHVLACLPESAASVPCTIGNNPTATLEFVAQDYVAHLKHHLNQIIGKRFETAYGAK